MPLEPAVRRFAQAVVSIGEDRPRKIHCPRVVESGEQDERAEAHELVLVAAYRVGERGCGFCGRGPPDRARGREPRLEIEGTELADVRADSGLLGRQRRGGKGRRHPGKTSIESWERRHATRGPGTVRSRSPTP